MILDELNEFADAVALNTGTSGPYVVGDVIDLQAPSGGPTLQDIGNGEEIFFVITVDTTLAGAGATPGFRLVSDSTSNLATSATTHITVPATAVAGFTAGVVVYAGALPFGDYERYLGVLYDQAGAALTAGKINAFLTKDVAKWKAYPNAVGA